MLDADRLIDEVQHYIRQAVAPLSARIAELENGSQSQGGARGTG